ncbi:aminotransferase class III-fold pyridoxal phosphate-dependent enzyme [Georgenia sp. EYE_87]|uniref:aminotransferase family protein n=1 Tax=Georgenia sp. EYE_87 TaxID=2853448 RepID=UPI002005977D|nr:aminotransferase class III-fold pyridoxal phosphate-dependent enzyme [Georgenia sp. EYE_87]MCK6210033.1 aminotransferase class III-fold pyridoxal phosphate-dependent enzyme [Georgenia sp. EYE_87]
MGALWHPFSDMAAVERDGEFVLARGEGAYVFDEAGKRYLDATAGLWYTNVGHGRTELAEAAARQMSTLAAYSNFGDNATRPTNDLAERLAGIAPVAGSRVFLTSGGSDSVETAAKLARRYWVEAGRPEKTVMVGRQKAYHGMHYAGTALAGIPGNREGYGDLGPRTRSVEWDSVDALRAAFEEVGPDRVAAFFCEPVIGAGGVYAPPEGYLTEVRKACTEYDVLFVADEVVTGYGRIGGSWFASTRYGLEPDLVTTAKGLTSGYLPMGAVLVAPRVAEPFFREPGTWLRHGYTYSGHATAAAVALANLDIVEREGLLDEAARLEATLARELRPLAGHDLVAEVRAGTGAVAAVQLTDPAQAPTAVLALRQEGVATRVVGAGALQVSPAFVMTDEQVVELAGAVRRALDRVAVAV